MGKQRPLPTGTPVDFDIAQGLAVDKGVIRAAEYDDGWLYQLDVVAGDRADSQRNEGGELWAWDFEVRPTRQGPASYRP